MHNFWRNTGLVILILGLGVGTLVGGFLGIPTIIALFQMGGAGLGVVPNTLQSLQIVSLVLGLPLTIAGVM
jgi:hypothetical protein